MIDIICNQLLNNKIGIIEHDTLPGIVAKATEENAKRIQQIKERSESKGFILLIPTFDHIHQFAINISSDASKLMNTYWPGPLTLIFEKQPQVSPLLTGNKSTIAIRQPNHPLLNSILNKINQPLLSTSANLSGESTLSNQLLAAVDFTHGNIALTKHAVASTIVDTTQTNLVILRQGKVKIANHSIG